MYLSCFFRLELKSLHKSQNLDWGEDHELRYSQGSIFVKEHVQQGQKGHYGARVKNVPRASINICLPSQEETRCRLLPAIQPFSFFVYLGQATQREILVIPFSVMVISKFCHKIKHV